MGVVFMGSCWKLRLSLTEPVPDSSKMDPPLAKAESISDSGRAFGIMYLRRGEIVVQQQPEERSENM